MQDKNNIHLGDSKVLTGASRGNSGSDKSFKRLLYQLVFSYGIKIFTYKPTKHQVLILLNLELKMCFTLAINRRL